MTIPGNILSNAAPDRPPLDAPVRVDTTTQVEKLAAQFVSLTFFGTLLKQIQDSPFRDPIFSGGQGGKTFSAMQSQHLAERISRGVGQKLVKAISRQILGRPVHGLSSGQIIDQEG